MKSIETAKINNLRMAVITAAMSPEFIHQAWYVDYHMNIVEKLCMELFEFYPEADASTALALAWIHDYEKIIDVTNKGNRQLLATRQLLADAGYTQSETQTLIEWTNRLNEKHDLAHDAIEIQIVSSADGASHLVGPFMDIYWHENPGMTSAEIQQSNRKKIHKDWELKITLPEVKAAFSTRKNLKLEATGELPVNYLNHDAS